MRDSKATPLAHVQSVFHGHLTTFHLGGGRLAIKDLPKFRSGASFACRAGICGWGCAHWDVAAEIYPMRTPATSNNARSLLKNNDTDDTDDTDVNTDYTDVTDVTDLAEFDHI